MVGSCVETRGDVCPFPGLADRRWKDPCSSAHDQFETLLLQRGRNEGRLQEYYCSGTSVPFFSIVLRAARDLDHMQKALQRANNFPDRQRCVGSESLHQLLNRDSPVMLTGVEIP